MSPSALPTWRENLWHKRCTVHSSDTHSLRAVGRNRVYVKMSILTAGDFWASPRCLARLRASLRWTPINRHREGAGTLSTSLPTDCYWWRLVSVSARCCGVSPVALSAAEPVRNAALKPREPRLGCRARHPRSARQFAAWACRRRKSDVGLRCSRAVPERKLPTCAKTERADSTRAARAVYRKSSLAAQCRSPAYFLENPVCARWLWKTRCAGCVPA